MHGAVDEAVRPGGLYDISLDQIETVISETTAKLFDRQAQSGEHVGAFVYDLEADATIASEYILMEHFLGTIDEALEQEFAVYIRSIQGAHGGWPLFHDGDFDMSASVKAYFALKIVGDDPEADHMRRARAAIHAKGGAEKSNVFTLYTLALYGEVPWRAVPMMPVELMLMPLWFPLSLWRMAYWSRTVIAPLLVLNALKPKARNPRGVRIQELFCTPPESIAKWLHNPTGTLMGEYFLLQDKVLRVAERFFPKFIRKHAINKVVQFIEQRQYGDDGLGGIYPAMANAVMAFDALGYPPDHPSRAQAWSTVLKLVSERKADGRPRFLQSCLSPVWDTSLAGHALMEAGVGASDPRLRQAFDWMLDKQVLDVKGDWAVKRPHVRPGGWAFQYKNDHYPDVDDTAVVGMLLHRAQDSKHDESVARAAEWVIGMQSANGGWGAFDADNTSYYLNSIPFADHGALLDPPTADVSARCVSFLAQTGYGKDHPAVTRGLDFLIKDQETDGSWFGRWGTNYIYGTWSALCAFNAVGDDMSAAHVRRGVDYLKSCQRVDGGWGEMGSTYWKERRGEAKESTPSQTAWAVLGLMAAGEVESQSVKRGIAYLMACPRTNEKWDEAQYTAVGFPRIFYLRYHGYSAYFPLWALARYRNLMRGNARTTSYGM